MNVAVSLIFYALIGVGVAVAVALADGPRTPLGRLARAAAAVAFWPVFVPILLAPPRGGRGRTPAAEPADELADAIARVEAELDAALSSLDGWAEGVLARESGRIAELRAVWHAQADRIRQMDRLLAQAGDEDDGPVPDDDRRAPSIRARRANLKRLRQVRLEAFDDLMSTLVWVRELVSMIHLAKFTGAPAARAEELVEQIAAAVEGVAAVTWGRKTTLDL